MPLLERNSRKMTRNNGERDGTKVWTKAGFKQRPLMVGVFTPEPQVHLKR